MSPPLRGRMPPAEPCGDSAGPKRAAAEGVPRARALNWLVRGPNRLSHILPTGTWVLSRWGADRQLVAWALQGTSQRGQSDRLGSCCDDGYLERGRSSRHRRCRRPGGRVFRYGQRRCHGGCRCGSAGVAPWDRSRWRSPRPRGLVFDVLCESYLGRQIRAVAEKISVLMASPTWCWPPAGQSGRRPWERAVAATFLGPTPLRVRPPDHGRDHTKTGIARTGFTENSVGMPCLSCRSGKCSMRRRHRSRSPSSHLRPAVPAAR